MKLKIIDYINYFFVGVLFILGILFLVESIQQHEYDKRSWSAIIINGNDEAKDINFIKVIDASLENSTLTNTKSEYTNKLESEQPEFIINRENSEIKFNGKYGLLPNSLHLKYYSINERSFYILDANLPYPEMLRIFKDSSTLIFELKGNGLVELWSQNKELIITLTAKKTTGEIESLTYLKSLSSKYNAYEGISNSDDFSDLFLKKYNWDYTMIASENIVVEKSNYRSHLHTNVYLEEDLDSGRVPDELIIYFKKGEKRYSQTFHFKPKETLDAFKGLDKIEGNEPIHMVIDLTMANFNTLKLSKGNKTVVLENKYPKCPQQNAN